MVAKADRSASCDTLGHGSRWWPDASPCGSPTCLIWLALWEQRPRVPRRERDAGEPTIACDRIVLRDRSGPRTGSGSARSRPRARHPARSRICHHRTDAGATSPQRRDRDPRRHRRRRCRRSRRLARSRRDLLGREPCVEHPPLRPCAVAGGAWNSYSGGFHLRAQGDCVPLLVTVGGIEHDGADRHRPCLRRAPLARYHRPEHSAILGSWRLADRFHRLQAVTDAALAYRGPDAPDDLLDTVRALVDSDTCSILLLDEERHELVAYAAAWIERARTAVPHPRRQRLRRPCGRRPASGRARMSSTPTILNR